MVKYQIFRFFKYTNTSNIQIFKCFKPVFLFAASEDLTGLQLLLYNKPEKDIRLIPSKCTAILATL